MARKPQPDETDQRAEAAASGAALTGAPAGPSPAVIAGKVVTGVIGLGIGAFFALIIALLSGLIDIC